jgi:hypothetical protein
MARCRERPEAVLRACSPISHVDALNLTKTICHHADAVERNELPQFNQNLDDSMKKIQILGLVKRRFCASFALPNQARESRFRPSNFLGRVKPRSFLGAAFFLFLPLVVAGASPSSNFVRVPFGGGASIEVPKNWSVLSGNQRIMIDSYVEAKGYLRSGSTLSFAANLYDDRGRVLAVVNTRLYPDNPATQEQTRSLTQKDIADIDKQIQPAMEASLTATGMRVARWQPSKLKDIGPLRAFVHEHRQTDAQNSVALIARGIRIWASPRSFTVTLTYRESESKWILPVIDRMTSSIRLD